MFESQAKEVMEIAILKLNSLVECYQITFDRPAIEYPDVMYNILFSAIKPIALKWIEKKHT